MSEKPKRRRRTFQEQVAELTDRIRRAQARVSDLKEERMNLIDNARVAATGLLAEVEEADKE